MLIWNDLFIHSISHINHYLLNVYLITKGNQPEFSLEGLKLKPQYFGHLMRRADSLEKTLMLGKIEGMRRRG